MKVLRDLLDIARDSMPAGSDHAGIDQKDLGMIRSHSNLVLANFNFEIIGISLQNRSNLVTMRVVHVCSNDSRGGAAMAAYRLHRAQKMSGIDSCMVVLDKFSADPDVYSVDVPAWWNLIRKKLDRLPLIFYPNRTRTLFTPAWVPLSPLPRLIRSLRPDLIHLHWVGDAALSIEEIGRLEGPVVWTCHDMWPFTGGEHYDENQNHHQQGEGASVVLGSRRNFDLSRLNYLRKVRAWGNSDLSLITPSRWMADCARESLLFHSREVVVIPNTLPQEIYTPAIRADAKRRIGIHPGQKTILFGAMSGDADPRKGFGYLKEALLKMESAVKPGTTLIVFGGSLESPIQEFPGFEVLNTGPINGDSRLAEIYQAADVMAVPSIQENFANTILEAHSSGIPVVAFDLGGNRDMIEHRKTGWLATPFQADSFAEGLFWALDQPESPIAEEARANAVSNYRPEIIAELHRSFYESRIARR